MRVFQVRHGATGAILWTGSASGEIQALDAMAHEAGYYDHADLPDNIRHGGLSVETLFAPAIGPGGDRVTHGRTGQVVQRGGSRAGGDERSAVRSF